MVFLITTIIVKSSHGFIALLLLWLVSFFSLRIRWTDLWTAFRKAWLLFLITFAFHALLSGGNTGTSGGLIHVQLNISSLTAATLFTLRFAIILSVGVALLQIFPAQRYGRELGRCFSGLPFGRQSIAQIELMVTLALRFVPFLKSEYSRLTMALAARGSDASRTLKNRIANHRRIVYPLMVNAMRRADSVAMALEARGFDPMIRRTSMLTTAWSVRDIIVILGMAGICTTAVVL